MSKKTGNSFSVGVPTLRAALDFVSNAAERRPVIPVLENVLIVVAGSEARVIATDLDRWAIATCDIGYSMLPAEFSFGVNLSKLRAWLDSLSGELSVSLTDSAAAFQVGQSKMRLTTISRENFPELSKTSQSAFRLLPATLEMIGRLRPFCLRPFCDSVEGRFVIHTVNLKLQGESLAVAATDGRHAARYIFKPESVQSKDADYLVPATSLPLLTALSQKVKSANVGLTNDSYFAAWDGKYMIACRMPTGAFPDMHLILNEKPLRFVASGDALKRALNMIAPVVAPKDEKSYIEITVKEGEATIATSDEWGEYGGTVNITGAIVAVQSDFECQVYLPQLRHIMDAMPDNCEVQFRQAEVEGVRYSPVEIVPGVDADKSELRCVISPRIPEFARKGAGA